MSRTNETNEAPEPIRVPMSVVKAAHADGRIEGIVVGLEMASKFLDLTENRIETAAMIAAAILAAKLPTN